MCIGFGPLLPNNYLFILIGLYIIELQVKYNKTGESWLCHLYFLLFLFISLFILGRGPNLKILRECCWLCTQELVLAWSSTWESKDCTQTWHMQGKVLCAIWSLQPPHFPFSWDIFINFILIYINPSIFINNFNEAGYLVIIVAHVYMKTFAWSVNCKGQLGCITCQSVQKEIVLRKC